MGHKDGFLHEISKNKVMYIMLVPAITFFILNCYVPMSGIYMAFTKFTFDGGIFGSPFTGLENFKFLFQSGTLMNITKNTILYNIVFIFLGNFLQIFTAILLSQIPGKIFKKTTQSIMFLPYFISYVILGAFVYNILSYETGFMNTTLKTFGMQPVDAYNSPKIFVVVLIVLYMWKWLGYGTVIYLAAIMGISDEYYEAAEVDGANIFQQIRYITIPLLKPTFVILLLLSLGSIMKGQFDLFYNVVGSNGVLYSSTDIIDTYVYRALQVTFDVGLGTAAGVYQSVFGLIIILVFNSIIKRLEPDYGLF